MEDEKKILSTEETENDIQDKSEVNRLDALLYDTDDGFDGESEEETVDFEAFMAEYRSLISSNLSEAKQTAKEEEKPLTDEEARKEYEDEYLTPLPKKQSPKKKSKKGEQEKNEVKKSEWDDEITLLPEEYEALDNEDEDLLDDLPRENMPDFDLGENGRDDQFQLSMSFNDESKPAPSPAADEEEVVEEKYNPEKPRPIDWVFDIAEMFVFVLAIVMLLTSFVFKHSVVEGQSMSNTLSDGDHLIISDLFYTPKRGDIIVFEDYSTILKKAVVKRVIGLPGETVEVKVDDEGNVVVYIDGEMLPEEYAFNAKDCDIATDYPLVTLGENEVFVMGDNRYHSTDSRHSGVGPIEIDTILGKVLFRFFPFDGFGAVD